MIVKIQLNIHINILNAAFMEKVSIEIKKNN